MNKEPVALYIFRFVLGFLLFGFMCMLYWSSTLVEDRLQTIAVEISSLRNDLYQLRSDNAKAKNDILQELSKRCSEAAFKASELTHPEGSMEVPNPKKPSQDAQNALNLLKTDPFFETTLPKLLGSGFVPRGTQHVATVGKPDNLHPFSNWNQVAAWQSLCGVAVAKLEFGRYETMAPDMALRVEERMNQKTGAKEFWVFLKDNVYWQPLKPSFFPKDFKLAPQFLQIHQVTAEDFKFYIDVIKNPYVQLPGVVSLRTYYEGIENIEVVDKLTFIVRWKTRDIVSRKGKAVPTIKYIAKQMTGALRPLPSFVYKYFADGSQIVKNDAAEDTYRTHSVWAQNFTEHWAKNVIVSCGPWTFEGMTDREIKFQRNRDFYEPYAALTEGIDSEFKDSPDNIWQAFKNNQLDSYSLQPDKIAEYKDFLDSETYQAQVAKNQKIERLDYVSRSYSYIGWNQLRPLFKEVKVRQALTMAIDRRRIIEQSLNGLGIEITGPFYRFSNAYDPSIVPWPFSISDARRLLEEEGWIDRNGDGIIDKEIEGKLVPFSFSLTYYIKNQTTKSICEYIATTLKDVGIDCRLSGVDIADLSARFDDKDFDALCLGWALGSPPEDLRQLWYSAGASEKGSSNAIGFSNGQVDEIIDQLDYEYDQDKRIALYHRFARIIHEEQPYTFLYSPKTVFLYREVLRNVFIPADRQDLVPGANIAEPDPNVFWLHVQS